MIGNCHICEKITSIGFCNLCCHWFCAFCSKKIFARGLAALKELMKGSKPKCCGPYRVHMYGMDIEFESTKDIKPGEIRL